jgi:FkbM family methyltransferase
MSRPEPVVGRAVRRMTRRWAGLRVVDTGAYYLGRVLGERQRTLRGEVATGAPILLSSRDRSHRHVFFFATYEPDVTALFRRVVKPGMTVLDVGANAGYFSLVAGDLGASVHAFEPNPAIARMLRRSVALGNGDITVVDAACSDHRGELPLHLSEEGNTAISSLVREAGGLSERNVVVPVVTLDDYIAGAQISPELVKIDAERHELEVIRGADRMLSEARPDLVVEVTDQRALDEVAAYDYRAWRIADDGLEEIADLGPEGWANVYFSPR